MKLPVPVVPKNLEAFCTSSLQAVWGRGRGRVDSRGNMYGQVVSGADNIQGWYGSKNLEAFCTSSLQAVWGPGLIGSYNIQTTNFQSTQVEHLCMWSEGRDRQGITYK